MVAPPNPSTAVDNSSAGPGLRLTRGRHTLEYSAAPFVPLRCQSSVPPASDDTCPALGDTAVRVSARIIDTRMAPERLPPAQLAALSQAISQRLASPPVTVQPGERYREPDGVVVAAQPL
jgi:hypothetical protein